jgi:hypothetical protein
MQATPVSLTVGQPIASNALRVQGPIEIVACTGTPTFAVHLKEAFLFCKSSNSTCKADKTNHTFPITDQKIQKLLTIKADCKS